MMTLYYNEALKCALFVLCNKDAIMSFMFMYISYEY